MKKPSAFKVLDLLTFGLPAAGVSTLAAWTSTLDVSGQAKAITWACAAGFVFIYAMLVYSRHRALKRFTWLPKHGLMVDKDQWGGYLSGMDDVVEKVADQWSKAEGYDGLKIIHGNVIWIHFRPGPITRVRGQDVKPVAGYVIPRGYDMVVGYTGRGQPLERTAFEHELGHLVQGHATGSWDEAEHHERSKRRGLP